jgi:hypothetical protein
MRRFYLLISLTILTSLALSQTLIYEDPGMTCVDVFAEDHNSHKRYTVNFDGFAGLDDKGESSVSIYPKPASGVIHIDLQSGATIRLFSTSGEMVAEIVDFEGDNLDLRSPDNGLYFLKAINGNGRVSHGKVTILK